MSFKGTQKEDVIRGDAELENYYLNQIKDFESFAEQNLAPTKNGRARLVELKNKYEKKLAILRGNKDNLICKVPEIPKPTEEQRLSMEYRGQALSLEGKTDGKEVRILKTYNKFNKELPALYEGTLDGKVLSQDEAKEFYENHYAVLLDRRWNSGNVYLRSENARKDEEYQAKEEAEAKANKSKISKIKNSIMNLFK